MRNLALPLIVLTLLTGLLGFEGHVRADPPAANARPAPTADWWESLNEEAYLTALEQGKVPADIDLAKVPAAVRPVIKEYFDKMQASWSAFKSGVQTLTHNKVTHLPREMIKFYMAVGTIEAWHAAKSGDPTVFNAWVESMSDVNGHLGFIMFSLASGFVGKRLNAATGMQSAAMSYYLQTGKRGLPLARKVLSVGIGQIGMVAGMIVNDWYSQLVNHDDIKGLLATFKVKDPTRRSQLRAVYLNSFKNKILDPSRAEHWAWDQIPHIESLVGAGLISMAARTAITLGTKGVKTLAAAPRVVSLARRTFQASKALRVVVYGMRLAGTAASFTGVGLLLKLGLWVGETLLFLAADHLIKDDIQNAWDEKEGIKNLQRREAKFQYLLDGYLLKQSPDGISELHIAALELERAWDHYRKIFMRKAEENYARHSKLIHDFDEQLNKITAYYSWFVRGPEESDPRWKPSELDGHPNQPEPIHAEGAQDDPEVAEELDEFLRGFFCGPAPEKAVSRAEYIIDNAINNPWNREDLYLPYKVFPEAVPAGFCERGSDDRHPLFAEFLKSKKAPSLEETGRYGWSFGARLGFEQNRQNSGWTYSFRNPEAERTGWSRSNTDDMVVLTEKDFFIFLNAHRLEFLLNFSKDLDKAAILKKAHESAFEKSQNGEASELRKRMLARYYRVVQKALMPALSGREAIISDMEDRVEGFKGTVMYKPADAKKEIYLSGDPDRMTYLRWQLDELERNLKILDIDLKTLENSPRPRQLAEMLEKAKSELRNSKNDPNLSEEAREVLQERVLGIQDLDENWQASLLLKRQEKEFLLAEGRTIRREKIFVERESEVEKTIFIPYPQKNGHLSQERIASAIQEQTTLAKRMADLNGKIDLLARRERSYYGITELEKTDLASMRVDYKELSDQYKQYNRFFKRIYPIGVLPSFDMEKEFWDRLSNHNIPAEVFEIYKGILERVTAKRDSAQTLMNYAIYPNPDYQEMPSPHARPNVKAWEHIGAVEIIQAFDQYLVR